MESVCFDTALPFFKDKTSGALYTTGRLAAEYNFWLLFFKDSETLLKEFKDRVQNSGRFISWDFIKPNDDSLRSKSLAEQYREALEFVKDCIRGSSHFQKNLKNLQNLQNCANDVINNRKEQLAAHANDGNTPQNMVHRDILQRWEDVRKTIEAEIVALKVA